MARALLRSGPLQGRLLVGGRLANVAAAIPAAIPEALKAISTQQQAGVAASVALGGARRAEAM